MRVLLYVSGSEASFRAADRALELAAQGAEVTAMHVFPPRLDRDRVSQFDFEPEDLDARFAHDVLGRVGERFRAAGHGLALRVLQGHVIQTVCDEAVTGGFDLVLMGGRQPRPRRTADLAELVRASLALPVEIVP